MSLVLWQNGLAPAIQCLQLSEQPVSSFREAVDRARRHEAASLVGAVSAIQFTHVPNRAAADQQQFHHRAPSGPAASGRTKNNRGASSNNRGASSNNRGSSSHNHGSSSGALSPSAKRTTSRPPPPAGVNVEDHKRDGRPYCSYDGCKKPVGHFVWECFQKANKGKKKAKTTTSAGSGSSKKPAHDNSGDDE
ncbi:unnamed protein product [Pylaiella littoralis]